MQPCYSIVCVDQHWAIGKHNQLLFHFKQDMAHFKEKTLGHIVVMGRKTFQSLPHQKPLAGRINIVVSRQSLTIEGATVVHSLEEALQVASGYPDKTVWMIGGEAIYRQSLALCSRIFVTHVEKTVVDADTFFPHLDELAEWQKISQTETKTDAHFPYSFAEYVKIESK